jgi:hypothetical protein
MIGMDYAIGLHDLSPEVGYQRDSHRTDAALVDSRIPPGMVSELRVYGYPNYLHVPLAELFGTVGVGEDFRRTYESKVERIKKQDSIFFGNFAVKVESIVEGAIR